MPFDESGPRREFPFEKTVRSRYHSFRSRKVHGLSSLFELAGLIVFMALATFALALITLVLMLVLFAAPFFILATAALRWLSPHRAEPYQAPRNPHRDPDVTIIDVEVDRS